MNQNIWRGRERLVLDGGMGMSLKSKGVKIPSDIWSASALLEAPEIVEVTETLETAEAESTPVVEATS